MAAKRKQLTVIKVRPAIPAPAPVGEVLDRTEAAAFLRRPRQTLSYWASRRQGPPFRKFPHGVVYLKAELVAWLDRQPRGGEPVAASAD